VQDTHFASAMRFHSTTPFA